MNQWQFDTTLKIIEIGSPVFYQELGKSLNDLVRENNQLKEENSKLNLELEAIKRAKKNHKKIEVSSDGEPDAPEDQDQVG